MSGNTGKERTGVVKDTRSGLSLSVTRVEIKVQIDQRIRENLIIVS